VIWCGDKIGHPLCLFGCVIKRGVRSIFPLVFSRLTVRVPILEKRIVVVQPLPKERYPAAAHPVEAWTFGIPEQLPELEPLYKDALRQLKTSITPRFYRDIFEFRDFLESRAPAALDSKPEGILLLAHHTVKRVIIILVATIMVGVNISTAEGFSFTTTPSFKPASGPSRTLVIISDLHLGRGRSPDGYPTEDFRWPKALKSFLEEISKLGNDQVDLLIAGDFLDMWQPPANIRCKGASPDLGCAPEEMKTLASCIVRGHPEIFASLRAFTQKGENRLHIIPGNHDAALLIADVWEPVGKALGADGGRVNFVATGLWVSADGKIGVEHGHQIGNEANRYDTWPNIVRREIVPRGKFCSEIFQRSGKRLPDYR
jgi:UDP-2,3-diacylglucosamine pyrophosphatase LpxH